MYALFLLTSAGWKLDSYTDDPVGRDTFIRDAIDMKNSMLLGVRVLGYDVHELQNQAGDGMKLTAKESFNYIRHIQTRFALDDEQFGKLLDSPQLNDMLRAMQLGRPDQVTVMLYQDDILVRKTRKS